MRFMVAVVVVFITGCVSTRLSDGLKPMVGQDIHIAVSKLGYPDGERTILGDHLYVWSNDRTGLLPVTSLSTTAGAVGGTSFYGTTTSTGLRQIRFQCRVELAVNSDNTITHYQFNGNNGGCAPYAKALSK